MCEREREIVCARACVCVCMFGGDGDVSPASLPWKGNNNGSHRSFLEASVLTGADMQGAA